jgi:hypothetical protein
MAKLLLDDDLWMMIKPLIPVKPRRRRHPGRRPIDPRRWLRRSLPPMSTTVCN